MLSYIEHYGEDADGNRGEYRVMYELQPSDRAEILEYIFTNYPEDEGYYKGEYNVKILAEALNFWEVVL